MTIEELYKYAVKHDIEDYDIWFNFLGEYQWESCPARYINEEEIDHECKKVFLWLLKSFMNGLKKITSLITP